MSRTETIARLVAATPELTAQERDAIARQLEEPADTLDSETEILSVESHTRPSFEYRAYAFQPTHRNDRRRVLIPARSPFRKYCA